MAVAQLLNGAYPCRAQYRRVGNIDGHLFHKLLIDTCENFPFYFNNIVRDCTEEQYNTNDNDNYMLPDDYGMLHEFSFEDIDSMATLLFHIEYECEIPITEIGDIHYDGNNYKFYSTGNYEGLESPDIKYYSMDKHVVKEKIEGFKQSLETSHLRFKEVSKRGQVYELIVELIDVNGIPHKYKYDILMKHLHKKYKPIIYDKIEKGEIKAEFNFPESFAYSEPFNEFSKLFDGVPPHIQDIKRAIKNKTINVEQLINKLKEIEQKQKQKTEPKADE